MHLTRCLVGAVLGANMLWQLPAFALDLDADGVSDIYLEHFAIAPIGIDTDLDDDGYSTGAESQFGTDPTAPASHPDLTLSLESGSLQLRWPT